jgi:hypothetical protein
VTNVEDETISFSEAIWPVLPNTPLLSAGKILSEIYKNEKGEIVRQDDYTYFKYATIIIDNAYRIFKPFCLQRKKNYGMVTGYSYLAEKTETYQGLTTVTNYEYGALPLPPITATPLHHYPTKITTNTSDNRLSTKRYKYPMDYVSEIGVYSNTDAWDVESDGISQLIKDFKIEKPVEEIATITNSAVENVLSGTLLKYKNIPDKFNNMHLTLHKMERLDVASLPLYSSGFFSRILKAGNNYSFSANNNYKLETEFIKYDDNNNVIAWKEKDGIDKTCIWGYNNTYMIALGLNVNADDVFFTSFEGETGSGIVAEGKTGIQSKTGGFTKTLNNISNGAYIISYWFKQGGDWVFSSNTVNVTGNAYVIAIPAVQVDEIKFFPLRAQVTTYTYGKFAGVTSIDKPNNNITCYNYDEYQRLSSVLDHQKNVVKKIQYNIQQTWVPGTSPQWQLSGQARCIMCAVNPAYTTNTQEVEYTDANPLSSNYNQSIWIFGGYRDGCGISDWIRTASPERCAIDEYGVNLGYVEVEYLDINPCSVLYNQKRWTNTNIYSCPTPTVYVKLVYENIQYLDNEVFADVYVRFFSDAACTHPYISPDISINYRRQNSCGSLTNYSQVCYSNESVLFYMGTLSYVDENEQTCNYTYSLLPGTGYIIVN